MRKNYFVKFLRYIKNVYHIENGLKKLTITDEQKEYAQKLLSELKAHGLRVEHDESGEQISGQIKVAQQDKVPWMLVIGKKEVENNTITLRYLDGKQEFGLTLDSLLSKANKELEILKD